MKVFKRLVVALSVSFILMNVVACFHAYKFTHFSESSTPKTKSPEKLSSFDKFGTLIFGVNNPRPENKLKPIGKFETVHLKSNKNIECWHIKRSNSKGTVIIFHGYSGEKSSMLDKSDQFLKLNYNTLLVDFRGSGNSEGNQTTLGYHEAIDVKATFDYVNGIGEKNIILFGTSMGAVAILKAVDDYKINPKGIIIECPFGSMYQTTCARFQEMNAPTFPMAALLVFWGGVQNWFWAFGHNPTEYAKSVTCSTLLLYGEMDKNVSRQEINEIYANLRGSKSLKTYKLAGHENYLIKYRNEWVSDVTDFLAEN